MSVKTSTGTLKDGPHLQLTGISIVIGSTSDLSLSLFTSVELGLGYQQAGGFLELLRSAFKGN